MVTQGGAYTKDSFIFGDRQRMQSKRGGVKIDTVIQRDACTKYYFILGVEKSCMQNAVNAIFTK